MKNYLITGATGYIGSMLIKDLTAAAEAAGTSEESIGLTALVRNKEKAVSMLPSSVNLLEMDLTDKKRMSELNGHFDYLIHCAAVTKSAEMVRHPVEVIDSIVTATRNVCELALDVQVKSMVYLSSMEVYGNIDCADGHRVTEEELGELELLNVRSCYPVGKRMAENICYCYYKEYGLPVKIARLAQTFGKGILPEENRVFAQFAKSALRKKDIVLHTLGNSMGNYCAIEDTILAIWLLLREGHSGEAYNVVNEETSMSIREVAELVAAQLANSEISVVCDVQDYGDYGYAADTGLRLSSAKLQSLGWQPHKGLVEMLQDCMNSLALLKAEGDFRFCSLR